MTKFEQYLEAVRNVVINEGISQSDIKNIKGVLTYKGKKIKTRSGMEVNAGSAEAEKFLNLLGKFRVENNTLTNGKQTYYVEAVINESEDIEVYIHLDSTLNTLWTLAWTKDIEKRYYRAIQSWEDLPADVGVSGELITKPGFESDKNGVHKMKAKKYPSNLQGDLALENIKKLISDGKFKELRSLINKNISKIK